jgi:hypothetical protein
MSDAAAKVVYEVTLDVDAAIANEYRAWLNRHTAELLALPGFLDARILDLLEPSSPGRVGLCVQYTLRDREAYDAYLRDHAERVRGDGIARFGDRFTATRRVLQPQSS